MCERSSKVLEEALKLHGIREIASGDVTQWLACIMGNIGTGF